jgi:hypothetical protein
MSAMAGSSGNSGGSSGSAPGPLTEFKAIYDGMIPLMCPSCHVSGGVFGDLDLSTPELAYMQMYNKDATMGQISQCGGKGKLIDPGNCEGSVLYDKIANAMPKCGRRMPLATSTVPQATIDKLCAWIKAGAKPN